MKTPLLLASWFVISVVGIVVGYSLDLIWIFGGSALALTLNVLSWRDYLRDGR